MREIKFRAWEPEFKKMSQPFGFESVVAHGQLFENGCTFSLFADYNDTQAVVMQYTGLKDKHGKPIFEGDIVKETWRKELYLVGFDYGQFALCFKDGTYYTQLHSADMNENMEILGNIHENPGLLE